MTIKGSFFEPTPDGDYLSEVSKYVSTGRAMDRELAYLHRVIGILVERAGGEVEISDPDLCRFGVKEIGLHLMFDMGANGSLKIRLVRDEEKETRVDL